MKSILVLLITFTFPTAQLIGTWQCVEKNPNATGEINLLTGKEMIDECYYIIIFKEDRSAIIEYGELDDNALHTIYELKRGNLLRIGSSTFQIKELTNSTLVLKDTSLVEFETKLFPKTLTFTRSISD